MRYLRPIFALLSLLAAALPATAQISIDKVSAPSSGVAFRDTLKSTPVDVDYFSLARYKAERAAIRKERNYLEIGTGLNGTLTSNNESWMKVSGGDNSITLLATLYLRHTFTKNLFSISTSVDARYGANRVKVDQTNDEGNTKSVGIWFKDQDEISISVAPSFKLAKNWSYGSIIKFRSQFSNGYFSRTQQEREHLKSSFLSPGNLDMSFGLTYKSPTPKFPISINLSPVAMSAVFVESERIRNNQWDNKWGWEIYGLPYPDETSKYEGGSSVQIDFDRTFGKTGYLRYRTSIYSFYGWITDMGQKNRFTDYTEYRHALDKWNNAEDTSVSHDIKDKPLLAIHPTLRWENTLEISATRFLKTTFSFRMYYNRAQNLDLQTQMQLMVGVTYTFKNK